MKFVDIKYFAGFFDGEGYIGLIINNTNKSPTPYLSVQVTNTNLKILEEFKKKFNGSITKNKMYKPNHTQSYRWIVTAIKAVKFIKEISPYLVIKKSQATLAVKFQSILRSKGGYKRNRLTKQEIKERMLYYEEMKIFNKRKLDK